MNCAVELSPLAIRDLEDIVEHLTSEGGRKLQKRFRQHLKDKLSLLADYPQLGTPRHFTRIGALRWTAVEDFPNHLVFYTLNEAERRLRIERILHGARNLDELI